MFHKVEAIVIRTHDYGETNKIVTIYTRELGKVGVMARGAKKPKSRLSSVSQLFTYGFFLIQGQSGLGTLQQGELIESFRELREDLFLTTYAAIVVELTDKLTDDRKTNPYLFELLISTLRYMSEGLDLDILLFIFETKMLQVAGIHPKLEGCTRCGRTDGEVWFSLKEAGFICNSCHHTDEHAIKASTATAKLLRIFYFFDIKRLGKISVKETTKAEIRTILDAYYDEYAGIQLKSKRFLKQLKQFER